ncbi:hypothetical protein BZG36_03300 [Bifiguratus adelaidae]|uniref:DNA repair protein RAD14 n=1 Tax=Bifiguratus adelaidae TaxID=1938954 RepID=A0A261XZM3_9FUNG|nr:hypothetical protein BZG36_03300 [Bifiguratus adelaidae]
MSSSWSEETQQRVEANKATALAKLKAKQTTASASPNEQGHAPPLPPKTPGESTGAGVVPESVPFPEATGKRARWAKPIFEYDLSKMVDSRGGFLLDDEDDKNEQERKKFKFEDAAKINYDPPVSLDPSQNPKCKDCGSIEIDPQFHQIFHLAICHKCKEAKPEKYSLITKTEAKEDYLLTDPELKDTELLPHWSKPNPRKSTWNNMMLYVREMVEEYAFRKWGDEEGLDAEWEKRESEKRKKKDKKFKEKLADMRKRTFTSTWDNKKTQHDHVFGDAIYDPQSGNTVQKCQICGLRLESEEF